MELSKPKYNYYCYVILFTFIVFSTTLCYSQEKSKATYFGSPDSKGNPFGACGYGEYGRSVNDGDVAAVSRLYNGGVACGACYSIACTEPECNEDGVTVVVTDHGASSDDSDFILSTQAFTKMAVSGSEEKLKAYGHVNIEYQRVSCEYPENNLMVKVHEHSHYPNYLAFVFYYQGGDFDITSVELFDEARQEWKACRRAYGAVWDMANPPQGDLTVRLYSTASKSDEVDWVVVNKAIPVAWKPGDVYDTSIQLS